MSMRSVLRSVGVCAATGLALIGAVPGHAQDDERQKFPQVDAMSPLGVDMQSGQFVEHGVDLQIGPLSVDHYIRSRGPGPHGGVMQPSRHATSLHGFANVYTSGGSGSQSTTTAHVYIGSLRVSFHVLYNGGFFPLDSSNTGWKMVDVGGQWLLTNKSGDEYRFDTHAALTAQERRLTSRKSADGHELTYFYDSTARLVRVDSNRGYRVVLEHSGSGVAVCGYNLAITAPASATTCAGAPLSVFYGFTNTPVGSRLTSITGVDGSVVSITYDTDYGGSYPSCVTLPNSSTCRVQNVHYRPPQGGMMPGIFRLDHVIQQTTAEGEVWDYSHVAVEKFSGDYTPAYDEIEQSFSWMYPPGSSTNFDGGSGFTFGNGFLEEVAGAAGEATYEYSSNAAYTIAYRDGWSGPHYYSLYPSKVTYPEGNSVSFARDWADNVVTRTEKAKPGSGLADQITVWTYPTSYQWSSPTICDGPDVLCDKPTKILDPRGNETDITYDSTHGGVLTKTGPADANGVRPQTRYTYVQRNARDANGTALQPPLWVLDSEAYCISTAALGNGCAGGAADEVVTTYDYGPAGGPNNLLLRGTAVTAGGETLRTCYLYDDLGRKIAETKPKGTGSTCP